MVIRSAIGALACNATKSVEVELTLKRSVLLLLEEPWKDVLGELLRFVHEEAAAVGLPRNDGGEFWLVSLDVFEHIV